MSLILKGSATAALSLKQVFINRPTRNIHLFIIIEDLCYGFKFPCFLERTFILIHQNTIRNALHSEEAKIFYAHTKLWRPKARFLVGVERQRICSLRIGRWPNGSDPDPLHQMLRTSDHSMQNEFPNPFRPSAQIMSNRFFYYMSQHLPHTKVVKYETFGVK